MEAGNTTVGVKARRERFRSLAFPAQVSQETQEVGSQDQFPLRIEGRL